MTRAERKMRRRVWREIRFQWPGKIALALQMEKAHNFVRVVETELTPDEVMGEVLVGELPPIVLRLDRGRHDGTGPTHFPQEITHA